MHRVHGIQTALRVPTKKAVPGITFRVNVFQFQCQKVSQQTILFVQTQASISRTSGPRVVLCVLGALFLNLGMESTLGALETERVYGNHKRAIVMTDSRVVGVRMNALVAQATHVPGTESARMVNAFVTVDGQEPTAPKLVAHVKRRQPTFRQYARSASAQRFVDPDCRIKVVQVLARTTRARAFLVGGVRIVPFRARE